MALHPPLPAQPLSLSVENSNFPSTYCCLIASAAIFCVFSPSPLQSLSNTRKGQLREKPRQEESSQGAAIRAGGM